MVRVELFAQRMNLRASQVIEGAAKALKVAATAAVRTVTETTPADTGQARSNWVTTRNSRFTGTIPAYVPGSHLGMAEGANAFAAQQQAKVAIDAATADNTIIVQNNLDYIKGLNDGTISQQSSNMVEQALQAASYAVRTTKIFPD